MNISVVKSLVTGALMWMRSFYWQILTLFLWKINVVYKITNYLSTEKMITAHNIIIGK